MAAQSVNIASSGGIVSGRIVIGRALWGVAKAKLWDAAGKAPEILANFFSDEQEAIEEFTIGTPEDLDGDILTAKVRVAAWTNGEEQYYMSVSVTQGGKVLEGGHLVSKGSFSGVRTVGFQLRFEVVP